MSIHAEVTGQFILNVSTLTAAQQQLNTCVLIEYAGLRAPDAIISYVTTDDQERSKLQPDTKIELLLATDLESSTQPLVMYIVDSSAIRINSDEITISLTLTSSPPKLRATAVTQALTGTSIEAITNAIQNTGFTTDKRVSVFDDSMTWITANTAPIQAIRDIWLHSYSANNSLLLAFDTRSRLRMYDTNALLSRKADFTISHLPPKSAADLQIDGYMIDDAKAGSFGFILGAGMTTADYALNSTQYTTKQAGTAIPLFSSAGNAMTPTQRQGTLAARMTDNVHKQYTAAMLNNKATLGRLSAVQYLAPITNSYVDVHPLDIVDVVEQVGGRISESGSGRYIVSRVIREITTRKITTTLLLNREARGHL